MNILLLWWLMKDMDEGQQAGLVLTLLALVAGMFLCVVVITIPATQFDNAYDEGAYALQFNEIPLGESGQPLLVDEIPSKVPYAGETIQLRPRSFTVDGCESLEMPKGTRVLRVTTDSEFSRQISVEVPSNPVGTVLICGPESEKVRVVIWAVTHE